MEDCVKLQSPHGRIDMLIDISPFLRNSNHLSKGSQYLRGLFVQFNPHFSFMKQELTPEHLGEVTILLVGKDQIFEESSHGWQKLPADFHPPYSLFQFKIGRIV